MQTNGPGSAAAFGLILAACILGECIPVAVICVLLAACCYIYDLRAGHTVSPKEKSPKTAATVRGKQEKYAIHSVQQKGGFVK